MRLAIVLAFVGATAACRRGQAVHEPDPSLNRMLEQPRYDPLGESDFFPDRAAMREPPKGTVPAGGAPWDPAVELGSVAGVPVGAIPVPVTRELIVRGRTRFEVVCATCHGVLGDGDSVAARKMPLRKPRSLHDDEIRGRKPGEIFAVISRGFGLMPALASTLSVRDRWAVVAYVRALQLSQRSEVAKLPADVRAELEKVP